jgi:hypothetical protein
MASFMEYVGADPSGMPPPDLTHFPHGDELAAVTFALAFAIDQGDGNFQPGWDPSLTPSLISQYQQSTGAAFVASLAGANVNWSDPPDVGTWVSNATESLWRMMGTYGLAGIDVDYENVLDGTFADAISQVLNNLRSRASLSLSIAPYAQTWPVYQQVVSNVGPTELTINYQAYADGLPDPGSYEDLYAGLAQYVESVTPPEVNLGGYYNLALGVNTSTPPVGLQPSDIYAVMSNLHDRPNGVNQAFVWSAEWLSGPDFPVEETLISILSG